MELNSSILKNIKLSELQDLSSLLRKNWNKEIPKDYFLYSIVTLSATIHSKSCSISIKSMVKKDLFYWQQSKTLVDSESFYMIRKLVEYNDLYKNQKSLLETTLMQASMSWILQSLTVFPKDSAWFKLRSIRLWPKKVSFILFPLKTTFGTISENLEIISRHRVHILTTITSILILTTRAEIFIFTLHQLLVPIAK